MVKNVVKFVPFPGIDNGGRVGVHGADENCYSCWSGELAERDWQNLRGKRLYNHPYTVRGFSNHFLAKFSLKIFRRFFCVDRILILFFLVSGEKEKQPWKSKS
jgi:hypothetical protein